ncbi:MAG: DNA methylase [Phycisphaerae bacterium]|nr:MAG: DNA methylase [Phycisphaerae bacterium]
MIPKECKRLAEVDFPIAAVSRHAAREKSIRHGHPSTLHLWWARRPLAACRSMLMALLLPDPCDQNCTAAFKRDAKRVLVAFPGRPGRWDEEMRTDEGLRRILLEFIADFADWDNSAKPSYINTARSLVKAAHGDEPPLVVDPFAGGGSIPLEALRVGCDAFASDLNPVACLINKVLLEDIPRYGPKLAEELRRAGAEIKKQAEKELAEFYPCDADGARPIAYLWARTVRCESPHCGAEIPLIRSFWLCKKANRRRAFRYEVVRTQRGIPRVEFEVHEPQREGDVATGSVSRAKATCLCCGVTLSPDRVRAQLAEQCGGADVVFDEKGRRIGGARMLAVVRLRRGETGRQYRVPTNADYTAVWRAQLRLQQIMSKWETGGRQGLCPVPAEPTPAGGGSGAGRAFSVQKYGMMRWCDLFTSRQALALAGIIEIIQRETKTDELRQAIGRLLACSIARLADKNASLAVWNQIGEKIEHVFGRQALPIIWDFAEVSIFSDATGNFESGVELVEKVAAALASAITRAGQIQQADACESSLPDDACNVLFTDPPYYDAIPYSDLSDYFLVWLRRSLPTFSLLRNPFEPSNPLSPKVREIVQDETKQGPDGRLKDNQFFEAQMAQAFAEARRTLLDSGIGSVVFAHKTTEGWEALLTGMIRGGWVITGSWPISTERPGRLRAQESAALAASVHLVCRPRPTIARIGDWGEIIRELPRRVTDWMQRLQEEGIRGADLVFACIGPALEIFSRYSKVETAEGREVPLAEYLEKVWEVVGRSALQQILGTAEGLARNGAAGALEEDARLTALFLWTMQSTESQANATDGEAGTDNEDADEDDEDATPKSKKKGFSLIYDVARRFAQPLGIHLDAWEDRIIETDKGVVRLLPVLERAEQLFGEEGATAVADRLERGSGTAAAQLELFPHVEDEAPRVKGRGRRRGGDVSDESLRTRREATTLDRVHAAMLLQAGGRANALRALLKSEVDRGPDFLRLANALSALYPQGSDEKRLLDAMLLAVPR